MSVVRPGALAWRDGTVTYAGPPDGLPEGFAAGRVLQVNGAVLPGFVDCHTHLPFYGWRADEFEARLAGRTYRDLHGEGGIYRSARLLSEAFDDEVIEFCRALTDEMLAHGTTALELKTGYGLSVEAELRQARLARRLADEIPQTASLTLLACHAVPQGRSRAEWVDEVCAELIPAAASEGLAEAVDVYVEEIAFGVDDLRRVADAAREHGLAVRCHADQLGSSGAAEAAVSVGARSADHLNHATEQGVSALAGSETVAGLLPVSTLVLRSQPPPVKALMEAGAAIAVATDFNPGTSPCLSMPEVIATAASLYGIPTTTAITAATINPACVIGLHEDQGSLEPGKRADFVVLDDEDPAMIPYRPGHNPVVESWIGGTRLYSRSGSTGSFEAADR
ncbi:MAG TPA: imidazolonepropionase [Actinomycetota bacterium]|nr:imidazolonepropionase [Actinomycetota bacterium]